MRLSSFCSIFLSCVSISNARALHGRDLGSTETTSPTASPTILNNTTTLSPTASPTYVNETNVTETPTVSPTIASEAPTMANTTAPTTIAPSTPSPSNPPTEEEIPTSAPYTPEPYPSQQPSTKHHPSVARTIGKAVGWLILIALSILLFGAIMSNRYRLYYALRGTLYTVLQMDCTRWLLNKLNIGGHSSTQASLNEIIFDQNDLAEGLLMGEAD